MGNNICTEHKKLNSYLKAYNLVKLLGFKTSHNGTKFIIKAILIILKQDNDFIVFEDIYSIISQELKNISKAQVKYCIKYAIDNRNEEKSINNFKNIFGYDYDQYIFTNKELIEELVRIIEYDSYKA